MIDTDVAFMDCYFEERGGRWKMPEADSEVPSFISTSLLIGYPDRSVTSLSLSLSLPVYYKRQRELRTHKEAHGNGLNGLSPFIG